MCGVAALFALNDRFAAQEIVPMTRLVAHRGPDGEGFVAAGGTSFVELPLDDGRCRFALGHRRLSILDLSEAGRQPMQRGSLWLTYNGEIFNFVEVRAQLEALGHSFKTGTDTEVLLAGWQQWGAACLERLRGMWGFVMVDTAARRAWLCRDRMGIKPLYLLRTPQALAVASEIKQLGRLATLSPDDQSVAMYLQTGFEDSKRSFFSDVESLPPGTWRSLDLDTGRLSAPEPYWFPERVRAEISDPTEAGERFASLFRESVRIHLRSDVPVGCALSGGLDSSAIAAIVTEEGRASGARLETFSARFPGFPLDESGFIDQVVRSTGARQHAVHPTAAELLADLDRFLWCQDEPPGSLSQYAAYAVARLTRNAGVPVTLNGQGGDEILGGYWQTTFASLAAQRHAPKQLIAQLLPALLPGGNTEIFAQAPAMLRRFAARLRPSTHVRLRTTPEASSAPALQMLDMTEHDRRIYGLRELTLPRLLKWDDRNFMAFAIEGRYPFLDHNVIEGCLSFNSCALFVAGWTKEPLRRALTGHLPEAIVRRRGKIGFETPQHQWLKGPLASALQSVVDNPSPVFKWIEQSEAQGLVRAARAGGRELGQAAVRLLLVDRWLRNRQGWA